MHACSPLILLSVLSTLSRTLGQPLAGRDAARDSIPSIGNYIVSLRDGKCLNPVTQPWPEAETQISVSDCDTAMQWMAPYVSGGLSLAAITLVVDVGDGPAGSSEKAVLARPRFDEEGQKDRAWQWVGHRLSNRDGTRCLDHSGDGLVIDDCDNDSVSQLWQVRNTTLPQGLDDLMVRASSTNHRISLQSRTDICLAVGSTTTPHTGDMLVMAYCSGISPSHTDVSIVTPSDHLRWTLPQQGNVPGQVKLNSPSLCLETGQKYKLDNGSIAATYTNGMGVTLQMCDDNFAGQKWFWDGMTLRSAGGDANQCIEMMTGSGPQELAHFLHLRSVQTWRCRGNGNQQFRG
ncbi:hypothetical protein IAU60_002063 [Kwoniella sp. DSM 27419]